MRDHLDQLIAADAVFESFLQVKGQLVNAVEGNEARDGNETAVTRRQARPFHTWPNNTLSVISASAGAM